MLFTYFNEMLMPALNFITKAIDIIRNKELELGKVEERHFYKHGMSVYFIFFF